MKLFNIKTVILLLVLGTAIASCSRKVTRVDIDEQIDLSGKWNDTDSKLTSEKLTKQMTSEQWLADFLQANNGNKPVMIVGFVKNKSHEHIEAETFIKDIERNLILDQKVRIVQGGEKREQLRLERADQQDNASVSTMKKWGLEVGADFMLQGDINSIVDQIDKKRVVLYQINLELTNIQTNEIVWVGEEKIKKFIKR
ncbi:MAG: penicillin-binding protein activator LpoB [Flavobacteriales bacterium]|jgi:uncharacterized protein (TIGR02722 family)|nr:penicillin-binding protein activator LpoB [Flavobacteriales bacterium]